MIVFLPLKPTQGRSAKGEADSDLAKIGALFLASRA